jgi:hypothetical protein
VDKIITIVVHDDERASVFNAGLSPEAAARWCVQAMQFFQQQVVEREVQRRLTECEAKAKEGA